MSVLSDGEMIVGDGSTDPVAESGATLRTSIGVGTGDNVTFTNITGAQISGSGDAFFGQYGVNYVSASVGNIQATGYVSGSDIKGVSGDLGSLSVGNVTSTGTITGSAVTRAGGGGGSGYSGATNGTGGSGGGGAGQTGSTGTAGTANTGGGGGGSSGVSSSASVGGAGGKGVVILSMPDAAYTGTTTGSPTVATGVSGKTVLTFTGSGSYTA